MPAEYAFLQGREPGITNEWQLVSVNVWIAPIPCLNQAVVSKTHSFNEQMRTELFSGAPNTIILFIFTQQFTVYYTRLFSDGIFLHATYLTFDIIFFFTAAAFDGFFYQKPKYTQALPQCMPLFGQRRTVRKPSKRHRTSVIPYETFERRVFDCPATNSFRSTFAFRQIVLEHEVA